MLRPTRLMVAALLLSYASVLHAQTPRVGLQFDDNLTESSSVGLAGGVTASTGQTPTYATDGNGTASGAIVFTGGQSLTLEASSFSGKSNEALGLRITAGANTSSPCAPG